jgi:hypothetical protein
MDLLRSRTSWTDFLRSLLCFIALAAASLQLAMSTTVPFFTKPMSRAAVFIVDDTIANSLRKSLPKAARA